MRYSVVFLAVLATTVTAQIPSCAQDCIDAAVTKLGICTVDDKACQCVTANNNAITTEATGCVVKACGIDVGLQAQSAAAAACAALAAAPAAETPAAETPAAETPAAETPAADTPAAAATSAAATTAAPAGVTTVYVTVCATSKPSAAAPAPSATSNGTITTAKPAPATFTGAASQMAAGMGSVVVAGVLAMFL